jgi:hypothetical protein
MRAQVTRTIGSAHPEGLAAVGDEAVAAKIRVSSSNRVDFGPEIARRAGEWRHGGKAEAGVHADKDIARQATEPIEHAGA